MALGHITKEAFEGLHEVMQGEYEPLENGTYQLKVEGSDGWAFENVKALKSALETERGNATRNAQALKKFEGIDLDEAKAALAKKSVYESHDPTKSIEEAREALKKELTSQFQKEKEIEQQRTTKLTGQLEKLLKTDALTKAILAEKGSPTLLVPALQNSVQMRETDTGDLVVKVVGPDGNERVGDSNGSPMTIDQLVKEIKEQPDYQVAFTGVAKGGTGTRTTETGGGTLQTSGGVLKISRGDQEAINNNFEKIATGEAVVVD